MESTHLAPRFRVQRWILRAEEGPSLVEVRDASTTEVSWGVWIPGRDDEGLEVALHFRAHDLRVLPLTGAATTALEVIAGEEGTLALFPVPEGEPWLGTPAPPPRGSVPVADPVLTAHLVRWAESSRALGNVDPRALWRTAEGPRLLPVAWLAPPEPPPGSTHLDLVHPEGCAAEVEGLVDRLVDVGTGPDRDEIRRALQRVAPVVGEELARALLLAREEGRWLAIRSDHPDAVARQVDGWARGRGLSCLRITGHGRLGAPSKQSGAAPVVVLEGVGSYAEVADPLHELQRRGWIDGDETLVVIAPGEIRDEALELYAAARFGRDTRHDLPLDEPSAVEAASEGPDDDAMRVLELLVAAERGVSAHAIARATALDPARLGALLGDLVTAGTITASWVRHAEAPRVQLVLGCPADAVPALGEERRRELRDLLAATLPVRSRPSFGLQWLRASAGRARGPAEDAKRWREFAARAQDKGRGLLAFDAYRRLLDSGEADDEDAARAAICASEQYQRGGDIERARTVLSGALERGAAAGAVLDPGLEAELVLRLAQIEVHRSDFASAEQRLSGLLARAKERLVPEARSRVYLELGWAQLQLGRTRESVRSCELALRILDPLRHAVLVARAHNQIGFALYKESDYTGSIVHYERALRLREQIGDDLGVARTHNNLALSHRALGQLHEAEQSLRESLRLKRAEGDELAVAASLLNLGFVQLDRRDPAAADESAVHCLEIAHTHGHPETEAEAWGLRGEAALMEGHAQRALEYLQRDLGICESTEHQSERLATLRRLAEVLLRLDRDDEAAAHLERARELLEAQPSRYETALIDRLAAELELRAERPEQAVELYGAAARGLAAVGRPEPQVDVMARRGLVELELGRHGRARATLAEVRELIGRHELHRVPEPVTRLERGVARVPLRSGPLGPDACLDVLVESLADPAPTWRDAAHVAASVGTALAAREVLWMQPEGEAVHPEGDHWAPSPVPSELTALEPTGAVGEIREEGAWSAVALAEGVGGGWLALHRDEPLSGTEQQLLRGLARGWRRATTAEVEEDPEQAWPSASETPPERATRDHRLVGRSEALRAILRDVKRVAATDVGVLILGENGTGKELVAQAIHRASARHRGRFVAVNCASIPGTLLESELFGHERGAFTSAHTRRLGRFELAHGGTLMLDEIGEMPLEMQAKILRVLQERSFTRLGGSELVRSDARIIAATNRDLEREVERGRFRMDLYFRLNVVTIRVPSLRERPEDIEPLAEHFLRRHGPEYGSRAVSVSPEALRALEAYSWPGNVRELENALKHALVFATGETVRVEDLPTAVLGTGDGPRDRGLETAVRGLVASEDFDEERPLLKRLELLLAHEMVRKVGNKTRAARLLGITKPTLYERLRRFEALYGDDDGG